MRPAPTTRAVVASIEKAGDFVARVRAETDRPGVTTASDVTVLGDGAEWIWNPAAAVLPQAAGVLDVYHAIEHVGAAVKAIWGESAEAATRRQAGVLAVMASGKAGIERWIAGAFGVLPAGVERRRVAGLGELPRLPPDPPGLRGAPGVWPEYRQRVGRGVREAVGEPPDEAERCPVAGGTRRAASRTGGRHRYPRLARLLGRCLSLAEIYRDTPKPLPWFPPAAGPAPPLDGEGPRAAEPPGRRVVRHADRPVSQAISPSLTRVRGPGVSPIVAAAKIGPTRTCGDGGRCQDDRRRPSAGC